MVVLIGELSVELVYLFRILAECRCINFQRIYLACVRHELIINTDQPVNHHLLRPLYSLPRDTIQPFLF